MPGWQSELLLCHGAGRSLTLDSFIQSPSKQNRKSHDPFFDADKAVAVFVKCPEDWRTDKWNYYQRSDSSLNAHH